jgi:ferredoxin-NADP reductase
MDGGTRSQQSLPGFIKERCSGLRCIRQHTPERTVRDSLQRGGKRPPQPSLASLEPGDWVWVSAKVNGLFTQEQIPDAQQLWMIATGTALGVYLSILRTEATWRRFQTLLLVHNVRKQGHFSNEKYH